MKTSRMVVALALVCVFISLDAGAQSPASHLGEESVEQHLARIREGLAQKWTFKCPLETGAEEEDVLRPGESFTYEGVSMTWEAPPEASEATGSVGTLTFEGPGSRLSEVKMPLRIQITGEGKRMVTQDRPMPFVYLGHVAYDAITLVGVGPSVPAGFRPRSRRSPGVMPGYGGYTPDGYGEYGLPGYPVLWSVERPFPIELLYEQGLSFSAIHQPSQIVFPAHRSGECALYVSAVTPLFLNEWRLTPLESPPLTAREKGGWKLQADNLRTGEGLSMPLAPQAKKNIGRFEIQVERFDTRTATALLVVNADVDESIKGRYAYISKLRLPAGTMNSMLDALGKECGFEVEWAPLNPKYPGSLDAIKASGCPATKVEGTYAEDLFTGYTGYGDVTYPWSHLEAKWKDDTHAVVRPKNHDEVIAQIEREERRQKESEELSAVFESEYSLTTEVYRPDKIKASTAKEIVARELRVYCLDCRGQGSNGTPPSTEDETWRGIMGEHLGAIGSDFSVERQGEFCMILACPQLESLLIDAQREKLSNFLGSVSKLEKETVLADEMSNSLIVSGIPKTHKRIEELLAKMEGLVASQVESIPADRYRIEVALLRGGAKGEGAAEAAIPVGFQVGGIINGVSAESGLAVKAGDTLAWLQRTQFDLAVRRLELKISGLQSQLKTVRDDLRRTEELVKRGVAGQAELNEKRIRLEGFETELGLAGVELEHAVEQRSKHILRAPVSGTVAAVPGRPGRKVEPGETVVTIVPAQAEQVGPEPISDQTESSVAVRYGISAEDLEMFGFEAVYELGKGVVALVSERSDAGTALLSLTENYSCELQFQDVREPYLILRGRLLSEGKDTPLLENTLYLEKDKPSLLGVTNLREALILVVRLHDLI
jgi:hypothetical protein